MQTPTLALIFEFFVFCDLVQKLKGEADYNCNLTDLAFANGRSQLSRDARQKQLPC